MERFAFIIHPLDVADFGRKYPFLNKLPARLVEGVMRRLSPMEVSHITGIQSATGQVAEGWFVGCPLTARQMLNLPQAEVISKIIKAAELGAELGGKIVGLGAFTSVVGDGGITIAKHAPTAITTGNSYTVATALEGISYAAEIMGLDLSRAHAAIVGATGSIGSACARILARRVKYLTLIGRNEQRLQEVQSQVLAESGAAARIATNVHRAICEAEIVVTVTSAVDTVIDAQDLRPGAIVCDVARPRDVSRQVAEARDDVLVFEGGVVAVPGDVDFHFNFGFPAKTSYACMAETMILALEGRYENFSLGKDLAVERIQEITHLAAKHGFKLAGLRSFERALTPQEIEGVYKRARRK